MPPAKSGADLTRSTVIRAIRRTFVASLLAWAASLILAKFLITAGVWHDRLDLVRGVTGLLACLALLASLFVARRDEDRRPRFGGLKPEIVQLLVGVVMCAFFVLMFLA